MKTEPPNIVPEMTNPQVFRSIGLIGMRIRNTRKQSVAMRCSKAFIGDNKSVFALVQ